MGVVLQGGLDYLIKFEASLDEILASFYWSFILKKEGFKFFLSPKS